MGEAAGSGGSPATERPGRPTRVVPGAAAASVGSNQPRAVDTRARILDAAIEALIEGGYSGATTVRIQELAGVSRGRMLHHYPSRDDLLVAAVARLTELRVTNLGGDRRWPVDPSKRLRAAVRAMWSQFHEPYFWASIELWLAARVNEKLRLALAPHERYLVTHIRARADRLFGPRLTAHPRYPQTRELLISSMRGAALTYSFLPRRADTDPQVQAWVEIATVLLAD